MDKFSFRKIMRTARGFTLVEIMVAAGLIGGLSLALMQMMKNINKSSKQMKQTYEVQALKTQMYNTLMNSDACKASFQGLDPSPQGLDQGADAIIRNKGGDPVIYPSNNDTPPRVYGDATGGGALLIDAMKIGNYENSNSPYSNADQMATLEVAYTKRGNQGATYGQMNGYIRLAIQVKLDAGGLIESCVVKFEEYLNETCNMLGGQYDDDDLLCKGIEIYSDATNSTSPYPAVSRDAGITVVDSQIEIRKAATGRDTLAAASATSASLEVEGGVGIGSERSTGDGNINMSGSLGIGNNLALDPGDISAAGDIISSGGLGVGPGINTSGDVPDGDGFFQSGIRVGGTATTDVQNGDIFAASGINVGNITGQALDPSNGRINVEEGVLIQLNQVTNQPTDDMAAQVRWVRNQIARTIAPSGSEANQIASDILDTMTDADSGIEVIKRNVCINSRVKNGQGTYIVGTYSGNTCYYNTPGCGVSGVCNTVYSTNDTRVGRHLYTTYDARIGRNLYVSGSTTSTGRIYSSSYIQSNSYIRAAGQLRGTSLRIDGSGNIYGNLSVSGQVVAGSRVCVSGRGCYTRFHSRICGGRSVMVGIRNGLIICANKW